MEYLRDFNLVTVTVRLLLAFIFGGVIGMDRERKGRPAGMRTHILVCLGASMTTMSGFFVVHTLGMESDPLRISAQVISGIGFLGVGTILITGRMHVKGLTTAAGLWTTASIGIALGAGFYEGALLCTVLSVIAISVLYRLENLLGSKTAVIEIYIELKDVDQTMLSACFRRRNIRFIKCRSRLRAADWRITSASRRYCGWTKPSPKARRSIRFPRCPRWRLRLKRSEFGMEKKKRRALPSVFLCLCKPALGQESR